MINYPITSFIEDLKKDNPALYKIVLLHLNDYHSDTLADLLIVLSDHDKIDILRSISEYIASTTKYFNLLPELCQHDLKNPKNFHMIEKNIKAKNFPLAQRNSLYWIATSLVTRNKQMNFTDQFGVYTQLFIDTRKILDLSELENIDINVDEKRVFIYTNQYLSTEHAPSIIVNKWADTFRKLNHQVIIVSSTPSKFAYPTNASYMYSKYLEVGESKELQDGIFLIEIGGNLLAQDIYMRLIETIHINNKDKFLLVGDSCLAFDILPFKSKYVAPTVTPNKHILTTAHTYIFNKEINLTNLFSKDMNYLIGPDDYTTNHNIIFNPPKINPDKTIKIAIVGNRLKEELDTNFWLAVDLLVVQHQNICLHIIGELDTTFVPHHHKKHVFMAGYQDDLSEYLKEMHFYLNPDREGGGHSAAIAVKLGIPIITLAKGDVYEIILQEYHVKTLNTIFIFIDNYIHDIDFQNNINDINKSLAMQFNNSSETMLNTAQVILHD